MNIFDFGNMRIYFLLIILIFGLRSIAQTSDSLMVGSIFSNALNSSVAHNHLRWLCENAPGRIGGSHASEDALDYIEKQMQSMPFDTIYRQPLMVRNWNRGSEEMAWISENGLRIDFKVAALGGSVGTGENGIYTGIIEVASIEELQAINPDIVKGKIVFFNKPFNNDPYYTFQAYGENAPMRVLGAAEASKMGAVAVIVRSLTHSMDTFPHTGITRYKGVSRYIPAFSICTLHADSLASMLKSDPNLKLHLYSGCYELSEKRSWNLIAEIKGSSFPQRIITVGGHIDSWDPGSGAHDDGAGCMQSLDVARIFFELGIKPRNTIRIVIFMDEEMDQRGAKKYLEIAQARAEQHYFALESDRGAFAPTGFSLDVSDAALKKICSWLPFFKEYGIHDFVKGGSGVDIGPLKTLGTPLAALVTESQRYFDYQHADNDTWDKVNRREMQLGSAAMAALIYLVDKNGL